MDIFKIYKKLNVNEYLDKDISYICLEINKITKSFDNKISVKDFVKNSNIINVFNELPKEQPLEFLENTLAKLLVKILKHLDKKDNIYLINSFLDCFENYLDLIFNEKILKYFKIIYIFNKSKFNRIIKEYEFKNFKINNTDFFKITIKLIKNINVNKKFSINFMSNNFLNFQYFDNNFNQANIELEQNGICSFVWENLSFKEVVLELYVKYKIKYFDLFVKNKNIFKKNLIEISSVDKNFLKEMNLIEDFFNEVNNKILQI